VARRQPDGSWLYVFGHGSRPTIARSRRSTRELGLLDHSCIGLEGPTQSPRDDRDGETWSRGPPTPLPSRRWARVGGR